MQAGRIVAALGRREAVFIHFISFQRQTQSPRVKVPCKNTA